MNVKIESSETCSIVTIEGRLDTASAFDLDRQLTGLAEDGCTRIIVDCTELKYISSSGLRVFLAARKKMENAKGKFLISNLQPEIREIFDIANFSLIFEIHPDLESAQKS
jgi:anti-anti-sigma factor